MTITVPTASMILTPWCSGSGIHKGRSASISDDSNYPWSSFADGFVVESMLPSTFLNRVPPSGADYNGLLNRLTKLLQLIGAGGITQWNSDLATAISGYPKGAVVQLSDRRTLMINGVAGNMNDPASPDSGWLSTEAGYRLGSVVLLNDGRYAVSTIDGNPNNPNISLTDWSILGRGTQSAQLSPNYTISNANVALGSDFLITPGSTGRIHVKFIFQGTMLSAGAPPSVNIIGGNGGVIAQGAPVYPPSPPTFPYAASTTIMRPTYTQAHFSSPDDFLDTGTFWGMGVMLADGASIGVPYWFDLAFLCSGGYSLIVKQVIISAFEV